MKSKKNKDRLIYSDLSGPFLHEGVEIQISIFRLPESDWVVELSGVERITDVLEDFYPSEESAYSAAIDAIREGIFLETNDSLAR